MQELRDVYYSILEAEVRSSRVRKRRKDVGLMPGCQLLRQTQFVLRPIARPWESNPAIGQNILAAAHSNDRIYSQSPEEQDLEAEEVC